MPIGTPTATPGVPASPAWTHADSRGIDAALTDALSRASKLTTESILKGGVSMRDFRAIMYGCYLYADELSNTPPEKKTTLLYPKHKALVFSPRKMDVVSTTDPMAYPNETNRQVATALIHIGDTVAYQMQQTYRRNNIPEPDIAKIAVNSGIWTFDADLPSPVPIDYPHVDPFLGGGGGGGGGVKVIPGLGGLGIAGQLIPRTPSEPVNVASLRSATAQIAGWPLVIGIAIVATAIVACYGISTVGDVAKSGHEAKFKESVQLAHISQNGAVILQAAKLHQETKPGQPWSPDELVPVNAAIADQKQMNEIFEKQAPPPPIVKPVANQLAEDAGSAVKTLAVFGGIGLLGYAGFKALMEHKST